MKGPHLIPFYESFEYKKIVSVICCFRGKSSTLFEHRIKFRYLKNLIFSGKTGSRLELNRFF